ncbi:uncharacterized protein LOC114354832, partial [Ostrinia furnacalis]|uniref:uncharacterized protein LOC114354832 n=1 Tax=Ostrinia furnacalis TaxID=93504 RepID=UPI00103EDABD
LQVIVLINLSQSFVLLTANMEDVRKLAKKFVSESLAEQIADFIAKVTSNSGNTANVSEENEENANLYHEISSEDLYRSNKAKPRSPNKEDAKKSPPSRTQTTKQERMTTERSRNVLDENNNRDVTTEPEKKEEDHPEMSIDIDPAPMSENVEATIKTTKHRRKPKRKPGKAAQSGREMTTEKEKNDFDQYDNKNYPKSEFVATSGPVVLPKVPAQSQWWEKEVPGTGKGKEQKRKAWF